jgi:hypothetical protein
MYGFKFNLVSILTIIKLKLKSANEKIIGLDNYIEQLEAIKGNPNSQVSLGEISDDIQERFTAAESRFTVTDQRLSNNELALYPELDTIEVKVTVFPNATLQFEPQFPKDSVAYDTIKIDSILKARLVDFPKVNPAIKRGIPVKTQFILPVILKVE